VLVREGIARLLERSDIEVVAEAGDYDDVLRKARAHKPDVAVVDIRMPPDHSDEGLRCAAVIRAELPSTGVLVLSQYLDESYAMELLEGGAEGVGYLLKDRVTDVDTFLDAVRRVAAGQSVLDPKVVRELLGRQRKDDPLDQLTPREREVLELMASGLTNAGIAGRLFVTEKAIERHVTSIFSKLLIDAAATDHRRVLAVLRFLQNAA
jgi:DNA-binding NarL/FixJ family response regulator